MSDDESSRRFLADLAARHGQDYAALSRLLGRNPAYIQQYIRRGSPKRLAESDRRTLARFFAVDEQLLGADPAVRAPHRGLRVIPRIDVGASAGDGALDGAETALGTIGFDPQWFRAMGLRPEALSVIRVTGDSMAPGLDDGDEIMVERTVPVRHSDGIHVIRMDNVLMVKRLAHAPGGRLSVLSDNPAYPDWPDLDPDTVTVIGRVVWLGRRL